MPRKTITLPTPHSGQQEIIRTAKRFNVAACGRRYGKSVLGEDRVIGPSLEGYPVAWMSPTYKMMEPMWREITQILAPITKTISNQNKILTLETGGVLEFWSLDDPENIRGRKYRAVVIDEAAMIKNLAEAWNSVIRPTLIDYRGSAWFLSTPKGLNYFKLLFDRGQSDDEQYHDWASYTAPSQSNPYIDPAEIEEMRKNMPEREFAQEVLAQFLETEGAVFRRVMEAAAGWKEQKTAIPGHEYAIGVDWGKINDFTVITVVDTTTRTVATWDRFNRIGYNVQVERLAHYVKEFNPTVIMPERNSIGEPLIERMRDELDWPVVPFTTTNASKTLVIDRLAIAIETGQFGIPDDDIVLGELLAFESERLPSGLTRYGAPSGMHDDCVMSLALGLQAINSTPAWQSFISAAKAQELATQERILSLGRG